MAKVKTRVDIEDAIKMKLGFPVVDIELELQQIDLAIDEALDDVDGYVNHTVLITKSAPKSGRINLEDEGVDFVVQVYKVPAESGQDFMLIPYSSLEQYQMSHQGQTGIDFRNRVFRTYLNRQILNTLKARLTFRWEEPYLYIEQGYPQTSRITIEYVPYLDEIEEVPPGQWYKIIRRLALAKAKYMLGRIRGKYEVQNSPFSLDGRDLIQEGLDEEKELLNKIEEEADIFHPM